VMMYLTGVHGAPVQTNYYTTSGWFPYRALTIANQLRTSNGRIFFPGYQNSLRYYDPSDAQIHDLGQVAETPPINPSQSTTLGFSSMIATDDLVYLGTQESSNRPPMICRVDPVSLTTTVLGYVGDSQTGGVVYAYNIAVDVATSTKYVYVAVGEDPWQLWSLNISTGVTTKLAQVTAGAGGNPHISFFNRPEGWVAQLDTDAGQSDNVVTEYWVIDGALYPYSFPYNPASLPFTARSANQKTYPLLNAPSVDNTGALGTILWQPSGGGASTTVHYTSIESVGVNIESLGGISDTLLLGEAEEYNGAIRCDSTTGDKTEWLYPNVGSEAVYATGDSPDGRIYIVSYTNGQVQAFDNSQPWVGTSDGANPELLGQFYATSNMKYPAFAAWASGYLYCLGWRERTGNGCAIGRYDPNAGTFIGKYVGFESLLPDGLFVRTELSDVVMSTFVNSGTASLVLLDKNLNVTATLQPRAGASRLGTLYPVAASQPVVLGVVDSPGACYQFSLVTRQILVWHALPGPVIAQCADRDGIVWLAIGTTLYRLDPVSLNVTAVLTLTVGTVALMAFRGHDLYLSVGANLYVMRGLAHAAKVGTLQSSIVAHGHGGKTG
jgi:hypothetical protein